MALSNRRACKQYFRPFFLNEKKNNSENQHGGLSATKSSTISLK